MSSTALINEESKNYSSTITNNEKNSPSSPSSSSPPSLWSPTGKWYVDILHFIGPGWFVSVAYVDPGNYQADIQAGALSRYSLLFIVWWTSVLSLYVQVLCVRLSYRSGMTLAQVQSRHYREKYSAGVGSMRGRWNKGVIMRYLNWFIAEFSTVITDLPEVISIGIAFNVFFGWPYYVGVLLSPITTMAFLWTLDAGRSKKEQINEDETLIVPFIKNIEKFNTNIDRKEVVDADLFVTTKRTRILELIVAMFVGIMGVALFAELSFVRPSFKDMITGWIIGIKDLKRSDIFQVTGIIGCVVMPHNLYLHTAACLSRRPTVHPTHINSAIRLSSVEPIPPILLSFFINAAVVAIAAERIYTGDNSVAGVGLTDFCKYFQALKGGCILWGIALLAAGQSAAITTTYAGQHVMDGFLQIRLSPAKRAILTRLIAILPCVVVSASMDAPTLNRMVNFVNSMLSLLLPFAFTPLVVYNCSSDIMGEGKSFGGGQGAAVGLERVLLYGFAFAVYAVNAWGLSVVGGGFFGDIRSAMEPGIGKYMLTVVEVTFQIFYLWWNVDCIFDGPRDADIS